MKYKASSSQPICVPKSNLVIVDAFFFQQLGGSVIIHPIPYPFIF